MREGIVIICGPGAPAAAKICTRMLQCSCSLSMSRLLLWCEGIPPKKEQSSGALRPHYRGAWYTGTVKRCSTAKSPARMGDTWLQTFRTKWPLKGLWSIYHIGILLGEGIWANRMTHGVTDYSLDSGKNRGNYHGWRALLWFCDSFQKHMT